MTNLNADKNEFCVIISAYMEQQKINGVVRETLKYAPHVIVIDDGSTDHTAQEAADAGAFVLRHERNMGKGVALNTGFDHAREHHFKYLITMDADGQHDPSDIPMFIEAYRRTGLPVLIGNRMANTATMPLVRKYTNKIMSWYLSKKMNQYVPDSQCGFRLYRCDIIPFISAEATRYAAESEILLHVAARGIRIDSILIKTVYGNEKSTISPFRDSLRFFLMTHRVTKKQKRIRRKQ